MEGSRVLTPRSSYTAWRRRQSAADGEEKGTSMKVAYIFATSGHTASYKLGKMILEALQYSNEGGHNGLS